MIAARQTDIAIVGGGLAGSTAAAMLARAGIDAVLIDPHPVYPPDFRCEKLDRDQVEILKRTGLADAVLPVATLDRSLWVARYGRLVEKRDGAQYGIDYDALVNTIRAEIPTAALIAAKVASIATSADRQTLTLSNGDTLSARLVVLANGLNIGLLQKLGIKRKMVSEGHSTSIGFDIKPTGRPAFDFSAFTYYPEHPGARAAYLTLFPLRSRTRANLFVYRGLHDPWLKQFRDAPRQTLLSIMPGLERIGGPFEVDGVVKIRPVDLYATEGYWQPGIVLIGDAFGTSCPAAGTGAGKALLDAGRLCNGHVPRWLATPGMGVDKIGTFYDDPLKQANDAHSVAKAFSLRSLSIDTGVRQRTARLAKFAMNWCRGLTQLAISHPDPKTTLAATPARLPSSPTPMPARLTRMQ